MEASAEKTSFRWSPASRSATWRETFDSVMAPTAFGMGAGACGKPSPCPTFPTACRTHRKADCSSCCCSLHCFIAANQSSTEPLERVSRWCCGARLPVDADLVDRIWWLCVRWLCHRGGVDLGQHVVVAFPSPAVSVAIWHTMGVNIGALGGSLLYFSMMA